MDIYNQNDLRAMSRLEMGIHALRRQGRTVEPADGPIPGLYDVSGMGELTTNQVASFAGWVPGPQSTQEAVLGFKLF